MPRLNFTSNQPQASRKPTLCHPDRSGAKWRDPRLHFTSDQPQASGKPTLCHPERSRGICGYTPPATKPNRAASLSFVIPSAAEGSAVTLHQQPNPSEPQAYPLSSRAQPRDLRLHSTATKPNRAASLSFVIPSAAEGSAVTLHQQPMQGPYSGTPSGKNRYPTQGSVWIYCRGPSASSFLRS